jgi:uncharacterized membrane protein
MSELVVMGFKDDRYRALEVLDELRSTDFDWVIELEDAVAVYRDFDGRLRARDSDKPTRGATLFSAGMSAAAALAEAELSGTPSEAVGAVIDGAWWEEDFDIDDNFVRDVGSLLQPGDSAIFALIETSNPAAVAARIEGYGGNVLRLALTPAQTARIGTYLRDRLTE